MYIVHSKILRGVCFNYCICERMCSIAYGVIYTYIKIRVSSVYLYIHALTLYLLMWRIWSAPNNASKGQMGFNLAFKGLIIVCVKVCFPHHMVCFIYI